MNADELRSALHTLADRVVDADTDLVPGVRRVALRRRRTRQGLAALALVVAVGGAALGLHGFGGGGKASLVPAAPPLVQASATRSGSPTPTIMPTATPAAPPAAPPTSAVGPAVTDGPSAGPTAPTEPTTTPSTPGRPAAGTAVSLSLPETDRAALADATYAAYQTGAFGAIPTGKDRSQFGDPTGVYYGEVFGATPGDDRFYAVGTETLPDPGPANTINPLVWHRTGSGPWTFLDDAAGEPPCRDVPTALMRVWVYPGLTTWSGCQGITVE